MTKNILVRRTGALGDVVLTTPVIRRLRRENPDARISIETMYPDVFRNSPHSVMASPYEGGLMRLMHPPKPIVWDRTIDLDLAYERRPTMHIVDAYMVEAFGDPGLPEDSCQEMFPGDLHCAMPPRAIAVHAAVAGWQNRTLPRLTWMAVVMRLKAAGFFPVLVGTERDSLPGRPICASFHSTDITAQMALIKSCCAFIGSDSGLLHVAGATDTPIVGVFTCALPQYRMPRRPRTTAVRPELECQGCLHRRPAPVTTEDCERGDRACIQAISADQIMDAFRYLVG